MKLIFPTTAEIADVRERKLRSPQRARVTHNPLRSSDFFLPTCSSRIKFTNYAPHCCAQTRPAGGHAYRVNIRPIVLRAAALEYMYARSGVIELKFRHTQCYYSYYIGTLVNSFASADYCLSRAHRPMPLRDSLCEWLLYRLACPGARSCAHFFRVLLCWNSESVKGFVE